MEGKQVDRSLTNVEIKAKFDWTPLHQRNDLLGILVERLDQTDTYFSKSSGRVKLREEKIASAHAINEEDTCRLIYYAREDSASPKESCVTMVALEPRCATGLKKVLGIAYGIFEVVEKTREFYLLGTRTRIHLDDVKGLGKFLEIEVVLDNGESVEKGEEEAKAIMMSLGIKESDLINCSYSDLMHQPCV